MKPDRKQPARAPAMPARHNQSDGKHGSAQGPLQNPDWYVIADEGELTLRISSGLRVGEDRWGELTLNHPLSAHRWLEFSIDDDGELWCRSSRKDIVVRCNGEILEQVMLDAGVPISLPHNLLHISNHIRRGHSSDWEVEVGLLEPQDSNDSSHFDNLVDNPVDTQADVTPIPEPTTTSTSSTASASTSAQISANDSKETFIPTLETVVVAPRPIASDEAGPAIERAVAKLKNRTQAFATHRDSSRADSTESALVPVDADGPFHTEEIRAALQQPINVAEPSERSNAGLTNPVNTQGNKPIYSPSVTAGVVVAPSKSRLGLIAGFALALLVIIGAALIAAISATPDNLGERSLGKSSTGQSSIAKSSTDKSSIGKSSTVPDTAPANNARLTEPATTSSAARTQSLLQTASALLNNPADLQPDTLDFAIRSLNLVLAAQPQNPEALKLLAMAEQAEQSRAGRSEPESATTAQRIRRSQAGSPKVASGSFQDRTASIAPALPSNSSEGFNFSDPRLAKAAQLIAQGAILAPRENSAISLIMSVLAEDAGSPEAVRLLNRSASVLVAQADEEYETLGVYAARNTLEEVLSFHPKHGPANQRWQAWVATGSPMSAAPKLTPQIEREFEPVFNPEDTP